VLSGTVNLLDHVFLDFVRLDIHLVSMQRNPTHTHQQEGNNLIDRVLHMSILGGQNALYLQNPHVHIRQSLNRVLDILFGTHTVGTFHPCKDFFSSANKIIYHENSIHTAPGLPRRWMLSFFGYCMPLISSFTDTLKVICSNLRSCYY